MNKKISTPTRFQKQIHVFLDLDETLIHSVDITCKSEAKKLKNSNPSLECFETSDYITFIRPKLADFILYLLIKFDNMIEIHIFTASNASYMEYVLSGLNEHFLKKCTTYTKYSALSNFDWFSRINLHSKSVELFFKESKFKNGKDLSLVCKGYSNISKSRSLLIDNLSMYIEGQKDNVLVVDDFDLLNVRPLPKILIGKKIEQMCVEKII